MTHDHDPAHSPADGGEPIDDTTLARLVRDIADDWHLPPQRLDAPTWRDRVKSRRGGPGRGWLGRLAGAAAFAIVLTVGLSLVAVWLTMPGRPNGQAGVSPLASRSPRASGSVAPTITAPPVPTALPTLALSGPLPDPTSILVRAGPGYAIADLKTGTLGPQLAGSAGLAEMRRLASGATVCLCAATDTVVNGAYTHAVVRLRTYDAGGAETGEVPIGEYAGRPDPRPAVPQDQPPNVDLAVSYSPDGRLGFLGWSLRQPPIWKSGIVLVDLATGDVLQRLDLPDASTGPDDTTVEVMAPRVALRPDARSIIVSRSNYSNDRVAGTFWSGTDHYLLVLAGRQLGQPSAYAAGHSCSHGEAEAGLTDSGIGWFVCWSNTYTGLTVRRAASDGTVLSDTSVIATGEFGTWVVAGRAIYFWDPVGRTVTRVDLVSGVSASGTAPAPTAAAGLAPGPLAALGRWLAPSASAKVLLQPGIVMSPGSGSRLYALGIGETVDVAGRAGSTGVFVFDSATLKPLDHWAPTADFVSLAVGSDGRFVYAAGAPGVDADGRPSDSAASITVYDASDGTVRLLAGELVKDDLVFAAPNLP